MQLPVFQELRKFIAGEGLCCVVKAPPGSGKSFNLLESLEDAIESGKRIAIAAQTNNQVDDLCVRFCDRYPETEIYRFSSDGYSPSEKFSSGVVVTTDKKELPEDGSVMIGTVAKLGLVDFANPYDILLIDEAWQMTWADFLTLRDVSQRFVFIGDPGQIPPTVTITVDRWEVSPDAPHRATPDVILENPDLASETTVLNLDVCRRLPFDSVALVQTFYDFRFEPLAKKGERFLKPKKPADGSPIDRAIDHLSSSSTVILTHPTGVEGAPIETDRELAQVAANVVKHLLDRGCVISTGPTEQKSPRKLVAEDIGIVSTHNQMNTAIQNELSGALSRIRVTTPERWQGLQRAVMIAVHPLSGVMFPSSFDLETGRLCVMASRHESACIFVTRDHVGETLDTHLPIADQALGRSDVVGRGHSQHTDFWRYHAEKNLIIR
jgi:hypothetical protein